MRTRPAPATARQLRRLDVLLAERDTAGMVLPRRSAYLTAGEASALITELEAAPVRPRPDTGPRRAPVNGNGAGPGVYDLGGDVFRLRVNRAGTGVYPERLVLGQGPPRWVYAPEVARRILPVQEVTPGRAAELGRRSLVCVLCGRSLSDPASLARGIGWRCWRRMQR